MNHDMFCDIWSVFRPDRHFAVHSGLCSLSVYLPYNGLLSCCHFLAYIRGFSLAEILALYLEYILAFSVAYILTIYLE